MRWIDMHCDTVSEIYKNRKGTLMNNTLCVDMERLERAGAQMQFFACFVNLKDYRTDLSGKKNFHNGAAEITIVLLCSVIMWCAKKKHLLRKSRRWGAICFCLHLKM